MFLSSFDAPDFDFYILPGNAPELQEGAQSGNPEVSSLLVDAGDVVSVDLNAFEGAGTYDIEVLFVADVEPADALAPVDLGALRKGEFAPVVNDYAGSFDRTIRGGGALDALGAGAVDTDEYVIEILSDGTLNFSMAFTGNSDLDALFLDVAAGDVADAAFVDGGAAGLANPEVTSFPVTAGQLLFLEIGRYDDVPGDYTFSLTIE